MNKEPVHGRTRQKYVHQQGVVTKARFVPTQNNRGYTGIFESGADDVIIRFSETGQQLEHQTKALNPSIALKFLRSGVTSGNTLGMVQFETDIANGWDFWKNDFTTHLPNFKNSENEIEQSTCQRQDEFFYDHSEVHESECAPLSMGRWLN